MLSLIRGPVTLDTTALSAQDGTPLWSDDDSDDEDTADLAAGGGSEVTDVLRFLKSERAKRAAPSGRPQAKAPPVTQPPEALDEPSSVVPAHIEAISETVEPAPAAVTQV